MQRIFMRRLPISQTAKVSYATKPHSSKIGRKLNGPSSKSARNLFPKRTPTSKKDDPEKLSKSTVSTALRDAAPEDNTLLAPVFIPEDPNGILNERHAATKILANSSIVVQRQLELMNLMIGFEQANKYLIMDPQGNHIGYMAEQDLGIGTALGRQMFSTHRSFTTHVFNRDMKEVLRFHRPFAWISSRIRVYDAIEPFSGLRATTPLSSSTDLTGFRDKAPDLSTLNISEMRIIGETHQQWAPLRRKYNLFLHRNTAGNPSSIERSTQHQTSQEPVLSLRDQEKALATTDFTSPSEFQQFAYVDERFLSWDFSLMSSESKLLGSVNRNFAGFGREIFTDTGVYALRMDAAGLAEEPNHMISKTANNPLAYDGTSNGMTLDQRAVMLATAVSIDFDYFSRHSSIGSSFMPLWLPGVGGEAAELETGAEAEAVEGAEGAGSAVDDASPTAGPGGLPPVGPNGAAEVGEGEEVWGNEWNPWDDKPGGSGPSSGTGSGSGGGDGEGFDVSDWF